MALVFSDASQVLGGEHRVNDAVPMGDATEVAEISVHAHCYALDRARLELELVRTRTVLLVVALPPACIDDEGAMRAIIEGAFSRTNVYQGRGAEKYGGGWDERAWVPERWALRRLENEVPEEPKESEPSLPSPFWIAEEGALFAASRARMLRWAGK
jgi:hypothetical protein